MIRMRGHLTRSGVINPEHKYSDSQGHFNEYKDVRTMANGGRPTRVRRKDNLSKYQRQVIAPKEFFEWEHGSTLPW